MLPKMKMEMGFINRKHEMDALRNHLITPANSILFLYGPKSSGKTTLMYQLFELIEKEKSHDINFLNLRKIFLASYDDFIKAFFKSDKSENGLKTGSRRQYSLFGLFKLDAFTEKMIEKRKEDPFLVMEQEFKRLRKKGITPVIIIDEFHKLDGIYMPNKQKQLIVELMNFFVSMTKESHLCHVVIASSDAFFIEQVYVDSKLRKTSQFMKLDYLQKDDVCYWLSDLKTHNSLTEYSLDDIQIEQIWDTVGGSPWEIYYILEHLFHLPLNEITKRIKKEKKAMITDWCFRDGTGQRTDILKKFTDSVSLGITAFQPDQIDTLGQAVKDNILYYDPVEGEYGIQGRSLEWGIKGYFDKIDV